MLMPPPSALAEMSCPIVLRDAAAIGHLCRSPAYLRPRRAPLAEKTGRYPANPPMWQESATLNHRIATDEFEFVLTAKDR
jgi:hypothetical protein